MKILYQGSPGAYSNLAALEVCPDAEIISCKTFDECFEKSSENSEIKAIIPESNKTTGNIGVEYLIFKYRLNIYEEHFFPIKHNLLGIKGSKINEIKNHLNSCDGVMIGRSIYQNPYLLIDIEKEIFGTKNSLTREQVAERLLEYLDKEVKLGTKVNHIMRHTVGLYYGQVGSKDWKRYLSDNMMARDSDFQKAKHIMTIVQNNEKVIQANT